VPGREARLQQDAPARLPVSGEQCRAVSRDRKTPTIPFTLRDQAFDPGAARNPADMVGTARPRCGHLAAPEWLLCAPWFSNSACQCDGNRRGSYRVALCVAESAHMINRRSPRRVQP
jgi:hypothetical protein